jgi:membrane-bound lytic murein transglycosylase MltF
MTLREGIAELRGAEGAEGDAANQVAPELARDLDVHDAIHVLFACPTSVAGEVIAHVWTLFGTTAKLADLHRVNAHQDHRKVLAQIGHWKLVKAWVRSLPRIVGTFRRTGRMARRWPVEQMEVFLDRPLVDIRREFGIQLPEFPRAAASGSGGAARRFARA